jgi:hypothetical protein
MVDTKPGPVEMHFRHPQKFSIVQGGPIFQLWRQANLSDDGLGLLHRRIIAVLLLSWVPLLLLTAFEGHLWGSGVAVPFLLDVEVQVRLLIAVPALIAAEIIAHRRMLLLAIEFSQRKLIPEGEEIKFNKAVDSAFRLRNSITAELVILALVFAVGISIVWRDYVVIDMATWYAPHAKAGTGLSLAGIWYGYLSLPIFQFLLCRWYFRLFIWARFLWQVSRIDLTLIPTHPDRVGGLGFLFETIYAFIPLLAAHGLMLAGLIGNRILHTGASLPDFKLEILCLVIIVLGAVLCPFLVFSPRLAEVRRTGRREYGSLAERYVQAFDAKWVRGGAPANEPLLGTADLQSLADLSNSYAVVQEMNTVPFDRKVLVLVVLATLAPLAPLLLTMMPLEDILKRLVGILI